MSEAATTRRSSVLVTLLSALPALVAVAAFASGMGTPAALAGQLSLSGDHEPVVLSLPSSVRALGSGNALQLSGRGPEAIFYNAALVGMARGIEGGIHRFGDGASLVTFSGATEWWGGGVAIGVRALAYGLEGPPGFVLGSDVPGEPDLLAGGDIGASELAASLAYGRSIIGIRLGVGATLVEQRIEGVSSVTTALDVGASHDLGPLSAWLSVQNLGPALDVPDVESELPYRFTVGASTRSRAPVGPFDLGAGAAVVRLADGRVALNAGGEVAWWPVSGRTFLLRVGHHGESPGPRPLTLGAGFTGDRISIDYAHQGFGDAGRVHRIGIGWR